MSHDMANRIFTLRKAKGMTLEEVGNIVGVGKSTVRKWETGMIANMRRDKIDLLAKALGTSPAYLMGWKEEKTSEDILSIPGAFIPKTKKLPILGNVACGEPVFAEENFDGYIDIGEGVKADFCLYAKGDSMINARVNDGDIVMVRKQDMVNNGEIAVVLIDNEATLKRLYYYPEKNKLVLNPENPKYEPLVYIGEELNSIKIIGKAVAFQSIIR